MGACGCGDYPGGKKFPGPKGVVYTLVVYPGCSDCDTPAGVVIHRWNATGEDRDWHEHDEPLEFRDYEGRVAKSGTAEHFQAIADVSAVIDAFTERFAAVRIIDEGEEKPEPLKDWVDIVRPEFVEVIGEAIDKTILGKQAERAGG